MKNEQSRDTGKMSLKIPKG